MVNSFPYKGLTDSEVTNSRKIHGQNITTTVETNHWFKAVLQHVIEPMFLLLLACATIYFILGQSGEGWFMVGALILVSLISLYQETKSKSALNALKVYTEEKCKVIRNNEEKEISRTELVLQDYVIVSEGNLVPADGKIIYTRDFSVNESLLTGESLAVFKNKEEQEDTFVFQGTLVSSGMCIYEVTAIGSQTKLGQIGHTIDQLEVAKSPLQIQINKFVTQMAGIGLIFFIGICVFSYLKTENWAESLLTGLTLAMSILPEEIPVAFSSFMALGAWRLINLGIIVKKTQLVEALGSAKILCLDKTGTITQNRMELKTVYNFESDKVIHFEQFSEQLSVLEYAMWASEPEPFDVMEVAIHDVYTEQFKADQRSSFNMVHEYPLGGKPPMMTHVYKNQDDEIVIAVKGAPEAIIYHSALSDEQIQKIEKQLNFFAKDGLRVLGVGKAIGYNMGDLPKIQQDFKFEFLGLIAFYDPPKEGISDIFKQLTQAGVETKIITGDNPITTLSIAKSIDFGSEKDLIVGDELQKMDESEFSKTVFTKTLFARINPDMKLKIINALKQKGLVAMTGDGVNDGPALKSADIGIAMGLKGTEIAKHASSIILTDDKIEKILDAISMGRKIYSNLRKAIRYIISIHIPIILVVSIPLFLNWPYATIFSPLHVIFFEIIMGPTCSIVFENEPIEKNIMNRGVEEREKAFLKGKELIISIIQGLAITLVILCVYYFGLSYSLIEDEIRSTVFVTMISANIFLTLANRSFFYSIFEGFKVKNGLLNLVLFVTVTLTILMVYLPYLNQFFELAPLRISTFLWCVVLGAISVLWFEIYKWYLRRNNQNIQIELSKI